MKKKLFFCLIGLIFFLAGFRLGYKGAEPAEAVGALLMMLGVCGGLLLFFLGLILIFAYCERKGWI